MKVFIISLMIFCTYTTAGFTSSHTATHRQKVAARWQAHGWETARQKVGYATGRVPEPLVWQCRQQSRCVRVIAWLKDGRLASQRTWQAIKKDQSTLGVKRIVRYWFCRESAVVCAHAFTVFDCENDFVASNGPSATGDWGFAQINWSAHSRAFSKSPVYAVYRAAFMRVVLHAWSAAETSYRWSKGGHDFSPWTCAHNHGVVYA